MSRLVQTVKSKCLSRGLDPSFEVKLVLETELDRPTRLAARSGLDPFPWTPWKMRVWVSWSGGSYIAYALP